MKQRISIRVHGYVQSQGPVELPVTATVRSAIRAAGGFGGQGLRPSGVITIRSKRKTDGRRFVRRRLDYLRRPSDLVVALRHLDFIIVQFRIPPNI
jgi:hypothetical protein